MDQLDPNQIDRDQVSSENVALVWGTCQKIHNLMLWPICHSVSAFHTDHTSVGNPHDQMTRYTESHYENMPIQIY